MTRSKRHSQSSPWSDSDYIDYVKSRCTITATGCWVHDGSQTLPRGMKPGSLGYTQTGYRGGREMTHRLMYLLAVGAIPAGHVVSHRCDNPPCCNPAHLKAATELENSADMIAKRRNHEQQRTHCPLGHPYDEQNTIPRIAKSGRPARGCKACEKIKQTSPSYVQWRRQYQRKRRAAAREQRT